jgi:hypothetical protein
MATKPTTKPTAPQEAPQQAPELFMPIDSSGKEIVNANVYVDSMTADDVLGSTKTLSMLAMNILAGNVHATILEAHAKKGGLVKLFKPKNSAACMSNADLQALRVTLAAKTSMLQKAWVAYCGKTKVRGVTLQALKKSLAEPGEERVSFKDAMSAFCKDHAEWVKGKTCPIELHDILVQFDIIEKV